MTTVHPVAEPGVRPGRQGPSTLPAGRPEAEHRGVNEIAELTRHECELLLRAGVFGRMVFPGPRGPEIVPVNYVATADAVLVRTAPGTLLDRCADGATLVFEVDHVDYERWHGWSVVVRGRGEALTEDQLSADERRIPGPPRWVPRAAESWIRLRWDELSGRRLGAASSRLVEMPVRRVWR